MVTSGVVVVPSLVAVTALDAAASVVVTVALSISDEPRWFGAPGSLAYRSRLAVLVMTVAGPVESATWRV